MDASRNTEPATRENHSTGGIQSLDSALVLLEVLAAQTGPNSLGNLAKACGIPTTKAHRYLSSFVHAGLAQTDGNGQYDLGKGAMEIGLAALSRRDVVNSVGNALSEFVRETGLTTLISVWGTSGPCVVRWQRAAAPVITSLGLGTTFPILTSATGRVFLAYLPKVMTTDLLKAELTRIRRQPQLLENAFPTTEQNPKHAVAKLENDTRRFGYATVDGRFIPGLVAAAAPVLDWQGEAELAVTMISSDPSTILPHAPQIQKLLEFTKEFSASEG